MIAGGVSVYSDLISQYEVQDELNASRYLATYDVSNESEVIASTASDYVLNKSITEGDASDSFAKNMFGAIKLIYRTPGIIYRLTGNVIQDLNLGTWMRHYFWAMLLVVITFSIIALFWRYKNV